MGRPDLLLIQPPQWTPQNPPFALASLGGHLRSRGLTTRLVDLNLEFYRHVLTPEYMHYSRDLARLRQAHLAQRPGGREHCELLTLALRGDPWRSVARELPSALRTLRGERFYEPGALLEALATLDQALELAALPYFPTRLALNDGRLPSVPWTLEGMEKATRSSWTNLFLPFFRERLDDLLRDGPRMAALSINSFSQVVPGLTLARLLKPHCHVTIGGNFFGRVANRLSPQFFELFCDNLVSGEGETALERVTRAVRAGERVPRICGSGPRVPLEEVGHMDLAGLPLGEYLTPAPVLCYQASRGCYWANCSFCDSYWGVPLDHKTPGRVAAEVGELRHKFGIRHFEFIDECLAPDDMLALSRELRPLDVRWFANARLEPAFRDRLAEIAQGGATMLLWGFESGSPEVLRRLHKGVHSEGRWETLRASAEAGLWNFAYVFFGFPGETEEEALATIHAISEHTDVIHSYGRSVFTLGRHSPMAAEPERYGLSELSEEGTELSVNLTYRNPQGPTPDEVQARAELCTRMCREAYGEPLWMVLRNRENLHLYLARYGARQVAEWALEGIDQGQLCFQK